MLDASHFASSSVSFSASSAPPLPPLAACCAVPLPSSSSSSSYLSPHTPLLSCSRPPLRNLPSSASSNRTTRCHGRRRPCSPWAAIISPSPFSSTPCRASPLPTGAPQPHPSANCRCLTGCPPKGIPTVVSFGWGDAEIRNSKVQGTQNLDRFGPQDA
jgi:hypothetical protein